MLDKLKKYFQKQTDPKQKTRVELLMAEKKAAEKAKKPWVAVLETHVNPNDIKNGFFELDWNNEFIEQLLDAGYKGETNEQIVDGWFKDVARNILKEQGLDPSRGAGYINVGPANKDGKSEIS
ncbi:uncharacterized protein METZ01_LOCUS145143 [marine metagenome]|uniref:Uncharacterized protein n=1 Tax=marine metagenome TaxID=408172 RepID=A0A381ZSX0_9ZZZZ